MSETVDCFEFWENDMDDIKMPVQFNELMEHHITDAIDPIIGAKTIQAYVESQSPDAQEFLLRKYIDLLNYHFMAQYMNRLTQVTIEGDYGTPDPNQAEDMANVLIELEDKGDVRVGGKMYFFEKHFYTDKESGIRRPIISLRMHSGAFKRENGDGGQIVGIENYVTIPITSIVDYRIDDRH